MKWNRCSERIKHEEQHEELWQCGILDRVKKRPLGHGLLFLGRGRGHWSAFFKNILDWHALLKKKWVRGDQLPSISPKIQHEIARLNRLFKRYKKNPTNNLWVAYKQQRNKVTSLKGKGIKEFCSNATSNTKHPGEFWQKHEFDVILSTGSQIEGLFARCVLKLFRVEAGASTGVPPRATVV